MALILYFGMFYGSFFSSAYKYLPNGQIEDDALTTIGSIGSIFNGGARLFWGYFQDKWGFKKILLIAIPF